MVSIDSRALLLRRVTTIGVNKSCVSGSDVESASESSFCSMRGKLLKRLRSVCEPRLESIRVNDE